MTGGARDWLSRQLLGLHLLAILVIVVCVLMGLWQLGVYGAKHEDEVAAALHRRPVDVLSVWGPDDAFTADLVDRRVRIHVDGYVGLFTVKRPNGQVWLATTARVHGTRSAIVVVLGHEPTPPAIDLHVPQLRTLTAILQPSEAGGPLSMAERVNRTKGDLFSGYALADDPVMALSIKPVKPPEPDVSWTVGLRNLAYALQWWVFGLFGVFMWWRMGTDLVAARRAATDDLVP